LCPFAHNDLPVEILIGLPWANPDHPVVISPVCAACVAEDEATKDSPVEDDLEQAVAGFASLYGGAKLMSEEVK
jgi:hypothetical protein